MRIERIEASWFRGAAQSAVLETFSKSVAVYGANGSGKSTFPDAIEYVHEGGRIDHLAHEYSGHRLEKGVRNTRTPQDIPTTLRICLDRGRSIAAEIDEDGRFSITGSPDECLAEFRSGDLRRLILRQDEVANFIHCAKSAKYSVLLPLLGLSQLEQAADNLRRLQQGARQLAALPRKEQRLQDLISAVAEVFPDRAADKVLERVKEVARRYIPHAVPGELGDLVSAARRAVEQRVEAAEPERQRHLIVNQILQERLIDRFSTMTVAKEKAREQIDRVVDHRIEVLERALQFAEAVPDDTREVNCPACGRPISLTEFTAHVTQELRTLRDARSARRDANEAESAFVNSYEQLRRRVEDERVAEWLKMAPQKECADHLSALEVCNLASRGVERSRDQNQAIRGHLAAVTAHFQAAIDSAPPTTAQLIAHKAVVDAAETLPEIHKLQYEIAATSDLTEALAACENAVRAAIRTQTSAILWTISEEIRRLWSKLHPAELIEDIKLYLPEDADKAIDIGLRFFGTDQPSPRLTLSEGHRNSLGLCIFLALVKMDTTANRPIVLDDVVSSLDREHRGFLVDVINEDFADRQVLLFTHDREWFAELRARLPSANWAFMSLLPWRSPDMGLQWSGSVFAFDEARALIASNPEAAGNRVRANMDGDLALIAEKLGLRLPYARGDRNDHRTAADFLVRLIADAEHSLRKKDGTSWVRYSEPVDDWREAHSLLVSWANPASHSGSLTSAEATRLLAACERALERFKCPSCHDPLWIADQAGRKRLQCSCGELQWRYD
jgi:hypothetical protein